ncbi:MAG: PAQR family membrane homeostasis protein TrhA [Bacteroidota bacterium]
MSQKQSTYSFQSPLEERYNTLTHFIGAILAAIGFGILIYKNQYQNFSAWLGIIAYGVSLILLFTASSIYHYVENPAKKKIFRIVDHISIYYLIAGTYSPVCLILLNDSLGWHLFIAVWAIALIGTFLKLAYIGKFEKLSLLLYLLMGWLVVIDGSALYENTSFYQLLMLALGGFFYTTGVIFYVYHRLKFNHVIWHVFVLLAAICHFLMILGIVH